MAAAAAQYLTRTRVVAGGNPLAQDRVNGLARSTLAEAAGAAEMEKSEITIRVDLGRGSARDTVYTCDLSYDYVKINADYRS